MAGATEYFGLAFFDFGDKLDSQINVQKEINRFVLIDKQLYGLYSVFGNGVISGWDVSITSGLKVTISPGTGIIESLAGETTFPQDITNLPANDAFSIYATIAGNTATNRIVTFQYSRVDLGEKAIKLADVTTGSNGVISTDTSVRQLVGFESLINYQVQHHRHTGSPPKIQLDQETKGLLPGANLANLDASKITSGQFTADRIAQIDHNKLKNVGFLTHAQLDSLAGSLQRDNEQLLGEVSTVNLLRYILAEKYNDITVDEQFINELAIIPGLSPHDFTDWDATTANVNTGTQCIGGIPPQYLPGVDGLNQADLQIVNVTWETDSDFDNAPVKSNLLVQDGVQLVSNTVSDLVIEDFEVIQQGPAAGFAGTLNETTSINSFYDTSVAAQGFNSGRFDIQHTYNAQFQKTYSTPMDWTNYNQLVVYVRSYSASHAAVYLKVFDSSDVELATYTLLAEDEITSSETSGFAEKVFDISTIPVRNKVSKFVIYTSNIDKAEEIFYVDNVYVRNTTLLLPQGVMRLRYSSATTVIFRMIEYTVDLPTGTDFRVRMRSAEDVNSLVKAPFGTRLASGDVFAVSGKEIEIELTFYANLARTASPLLTFLQLQLMVEAESSGFTVKDITAWNRGTLENISVGTSAGNAYTHLTYANIGNMYFLYQDTVNEVNPSLVPEFGVNGSNLPISALQAFNALSGAPSRGFTNAKSVYRLMTGDYLVADTDNDRVVQLKPDGTFVRGYGCHNRDYDTAIYALSAVYNSRLGKLFITYSAEQPLAIYDLKKVHISWGNNTLTLDNNSDHIRTLDTDQVVTYDLSAPTSVTDRIVSISLAKNHQDQLRNVTEPIYVQIDSDPDLNYIEVFNNDFMYYGRGAIVHPVFVNKLDDTRWMIANSHLFKGYDDLAATTDGKKMIADLVSKTISVINIEEDTGLIVFNQSLNIFDFTYNGIDFSDTTIGGIYPLEKDRLLISGLRPIPTSSTSSSSSTSVSGSQDTITDADRVTGYQGYVILLDKSKSRILFAYESPEGLFPSDVIEDEDGLFVVAETSFIPQAGRIIRLDRFGNIVSVISDGMYTRINDIRNLPSKHLLVST